MTRVSLFVVATCASMLLVSPALGQFGGPGGGGGGPGGGGRGGGGGGPNAGPSDPTRSMKPPAPQVVLTPHGGEYLQTEAVQYEIVYMPLQTRIYLFDNKLKSLSARDVHVQMSLTLPSESNPRRIPFQYVATPSVAGEQDYVVAVFDMRQLRARETPITFEFSGLPDRKHPTASFTPVFSPSKIRPFVARVLLTHTDRDGVMRQRVCPVSRQVLGTRGPIIKLYLADVPLYVSGEDCIAAVEQAPEKYVRRPTAQR